MIEDFRGPGFVNDKVMDLFQNSTGDFNIVLELVHASIEQF